MDISGKTSQGNKVLLLEDNPDDLLIVRTHLEHMELEVYEANTKLGAEKLFNLHQYCLAIIHIESDPRIGLELCRLIRAASNVPILMLTDRMESVDEEMAIKAGADDYITKPLDLNILTSRINQQLKRGNSHPLPVIDIFNWHSLQMDLNQHLFTISGKTVELTRTEFQFLQLLIEDPQKIFSRNQILHAIGVPRGIGTGHIVDSHASRIRTKIRANGGPEVIAVIRSVGFRLANPAPTSN